MTGPVINMEELNAILTAIQDGSGSRKRKGNSVKRPRPTPEETELRRKANDAECIRAFTAKGYKDVRPRINVLTYRKWLEKGRQVRKDEEGTAVGPFNLFHQDQTEHIAAPEATTASPE